MTKVQRYKVGYWSIISPCLIPDDSGFAVKFEDYCKLEAENERLESENERLKHNLATTEQTAEALANARLIAAVLRKEAHPAITHCDKCGCDWLDNGLNPVGCPYCELHRETERRWEGNRRAAQEYVEDMRDVLKEAAQICKDLDDEALTKEGRLACGAECAGAIADLAARMNVPFERAGSLSKEDRND